MGEFYLFDSLFMKLIILCMFMKLIILVFLYFRSLCGRGLGCYHPPNSFLRVQSTEHTALNLSFFFSLHCFLLNYGGQF